MDPVIQLKTIFDEHNLWIKTIALKRNEYLKVKGSVDTNLYYVMDGTIRIYIEDEFEEHTIRFGYKGNFIAALDSQISEQASPLYMQALKKSTVKVVRKKDYETVMESRREYLSLWRKIMEGLVYSQLEREIDILTYSPKDRYRRVLERSPHLFQEIPSKYIASYLRMTPETLSRLKKS